MTRTALVLLAAILAATLVGAAGVSPAAALSIKRCGADAGPKAHIGKTTLDHYGVFGVNIACGFARTTVRAIVKQHLRNSSTPVRAKAPRGWICVAQEVRSHVAVAGHCQRGRSSVLSWVGVGLHL
jgi:hypothetical protein